jgi:hypothetical protein
MTRVVQDFKIRDGAWMTSYKMYHKQYLTKSRRLWMGMRGRCKVGGSTQQERATYIGCTMSVNFRDFQFFADWCQVQVGYGEDGYELDKDILSKGAKIYHEDMCVCVRASCTECFLVSSYCK